MTWDRLALGHLLEGDPALCRAVAEGASLVVAGQQPALGGGPLYTLIKAIQARELARIEGLVPVFWIAGEDHDVGEAGHVDLLTREGRVQRCQVALTGRAALRHRPAREGWDDLMVACAKYLGPGLGTAWVQAQAPSEGETWSAWQGRLLRALVPGLLTVESHRLRPLWRTALHRALTAWPVTALAEERSRLLAEGMADAFGPMTEAPVFADLPESRVAMTPAAALARWETDPDSLSPGAALRPLLQQAALPCTRFIAGPGEAAYHRFLAPAYAALGVEPPRLIRRTSCTLVPGWLARAGTGWGLTVESLAGSVPPSVMPTIPPDPAVLNALDEAIRRTALVAPAAARRLERERVRLLRELSRVARKQRNLPAIGILRSYVRPRELRQERVLGIIPAVWEHGPGVVQVLAAGLAGASTGGELFLRLDQA